ncbi:hypothetical protein LSH36_219g00030, partial [Paralvinella palmiformis]
ISKKTRSVARTFQRKRQDQIGAPRNVENVTALVTSAEIFTYEGTSILRFDSGPGEGRILIFGNTEDMHTLRRVKHLCMDGTFRACPSITSQLFTLHELFKDKVLRILSLKRVTKHF